MDGANATKDKRLAFRLLHNNPSITHNMDHRDMTNNRCVQNFTHARESQLCNLATFIAALSNYHNTQKNSTRMAIRISFCVMKLLI